MTSLPEDQLTTQAATGLELPYKQFGKPYKLTYEFADAMLRRRTEELRGEDEELNVYMIGGKYSNPGAGNTPDFGADMTDNPLSDIWGANAYGWDSILVRTGVYPGGEPSHAPTMIADDVELAVEWALKREAERERERVRGVEAVGA